MKKSNQSKVLNKLRFTDEYRWKWGDIISLKIAKMCFFRNFQTLTSSLSSIPFWMSWVNSKQMILLFENKSVSSSETLTSLNCWSLKFHFPLVRQFIFSSSFLKPKLRVSIRTFSCWRINMCRVESKLFRVWAFPEAFCKDLFCPLWSHFYVVYFNRFYVSTVHLWYGES